MKYFFLLFGLMFWIIAAFADLKCPNLFHVRQDSAARAFHIHEDEDSFGVVVNSEYGKFDFYDAQHKKCYINRFDSLFDNSENLLATAKISDRYWFTQSTQMEIFSPEGELLLIIGPEGGNDCFVFRDAKTSKPLAVALLEWIPQYKSYFSWSYIHDWSVMVVDPSKFEEKRIFLVYLIWALLKHSQRFFPSPYDVKYEVDPTLSEEKR